MTEPASLRDLSARAHAQLLESVVLNANDAIVITEADPIDMPGPCIVYVNPAFTRMTGYTSDEALGKTPRILQGPKTSAPARAQVRAALTAGRPITLELLNYSKDGREFWVELSISPVAGDPGKLTHWISVQRDVTQRRALEEALMRERISAEKTMALSTEIEQRRRAEAQLAYSAVHDGTTGLRNRAFFITLLDAAVVRSHADAAYRYSVIRLDFDRFKYMNDRLAYRIGDRVLCDLARRIERWAGPRTTIARVGPAEFAVLLEAPDDARAVLAVAGKLLAEIGARPPPIDADDVTIAASVGIVHARPEYRGADEVLRDADTAAVKARRLRGNACVVFSDEMRDEAERALGIRNDLQGAVERGEMRLFYQPLVDSTLGQIYGFEALIRWQHAERGLVSPADFIPIAEASGLIIEIGGWVLLEGCRMAREMQTLAQRPIRMNINVSTHQLLRPQFIEDLQAALASTELEPHLLQLEITESVFLAGTDVVGATIARIRAFGVLVALDDFGTGYSSLSYLESFQIDTLKIDQSFVLRINDAYAKSEIVRVIIGFAHALGVGVVAEGVETRAQRDALIRLGCTHLQGYLFSRPLPAADGRDVFAAGSTRAASLGTLLGESLSSANVRPLSPEQRAELHLQVQAALQALDTWMERLHAAVDTGKMLQFDLAEIARADACPIGIWLNTTIPEPLKAMSLYRVSKERHAVFHRSMARVFAAVGAKLPSATQALRPHGDMAMAAASLEQALRDWIAVEPEPAAPVSAQSAAASVATTFAP